MLCKVLASKSIVALYQAGISVPSFELDLFGRLRSLTHVWSHQGHWHMRASQLIDLGIDRLVSPEPRVAHRSQPVVTVRLTPVATA